MPVTGRSVSAYVPHQQTVNEENAANLAQALNAITRSKMEGQQQLADIAAKGEQERQSQEAGRQGMLQTMQGISGTESPEEAFNKLSGSGRSFNINERGISGGMDPALHLKMQQDKQAGAEATKLGKEHDTMLKPYDAQLTALRNVHLGLDSNSSTGDKQAMVNLARLSEGSGQRLLQSVIQTMGGDKTAYSTSQGMVNFLNSAANSKLSPEIRNAIRQHVINYYDTLKPEINSKQSEFEQRAGLEAQILGQRGQLGDYIKASRGSLGSKMEDLDKLGSQYKSAQMPNPTMQPAAQAAAPKSRLEMMGDMLGQLIKGPSQQQPAQGAPQMAAPSPAAPSPGGRTVVKRLMSPSTGKTKVIYDDGTEEIQ